MYLPIKCLISRIIGIVGLVVLSPLLILIAIIIKIDSKGHVLFKQERLGLHGQVFNMYKFRSMKPDSEHTGSGVYSFADDPRVTRVGKILRATSLDELPQLFNLANGTMHLISCRPPLTYHPWPIDQYTEHQLRMFELRPGLTGWAQVHGRKDVEWNQRIELNIWYVDHVSFPLDVKIFFMTIAQVIRNKDNENTNATVNDSEV